MKNNGVDAKEKTTAKVIFRVKERLLGDSYFGLGFKNDL